ncbi:MAG: nucleotidyl transferase AbiEii/AbiGii toxin family protein [Candidatus Aminicenantes bacterium]|nr:nucleotidyl transferase AbiEii/AbiGii toxin family protein [Candidatus Aminicenantes bacterium]
MSYENTIYPLQDKVLSALEGAGTPFYLTGGTALSRCYFHHRYSDDLDFFVNDDDRFGHGMVTILSALTRAALSAEVLIDEIRFKRLMIERTLKIEFVNDVPFYLGTTQSIPGFPFSKVDNLLNILANKITAFRDRTEAKDLVDIRQIALETRPDWRLIFSAAESKAAGIFPPEIAEKMERFDPAGLDRIVWTVRPEPAVFIEDIRKIAASMLAVV